MSKPSPLLLMTHNLGIGGSERQMVEVAKSLDRSRFQPHVGCFHSGGLRKAELREAGVPIVQLPVTGFGTRSALTGRLQLARYIRANGIQLVHSFDVPLNIFAAPVSWLLRHPVVLTSQRAHRLLTPGLYHRLLRITDRLTDGIIVNCEFMRNHLVCDEGVPPRLIHLCYNGIDTRIFCPGPREPHPDLEGRGPVVGVVCALRPEKGLTTLIDAFAVIAQSRQRAKLVIVGSGPQLGELQARALQRGILDFCLFIPSTTDVASWLRQMDVFVLPSLSEALSNSLMEAMACGYCAVASNVGGNRELIGDYQRGLLFDSSDAASLVGALERVLAAPEGARQMAEAALDFVRSGLTLAQSTSRMEQIYSSFLDAKPY